MGLYYKFMKALAKPIFKKSEIICKEPLSEEPSIFLCNHSQAHGPAQMTLWFDRPHKTWLINYAIDKKKNSNYVFHDFFFGRSKKCKPFWRALSKVVAVLLRPLLLSSNPIPVYHDSRIMTTFKDSLEALADGKDVVIFPECPTKFSEYICDLYSGFADLGRMYYSETGKRLKFYPTYVAHPLRKILVGSPIEYDPEIPPRKQRDIIAAYCRDTIDEMARSLPDHKPAPFLPKEWYDYYGDCEKDMAEYWKLFD